MLFILLGVFAGACSPVQTSVNTRLKRKLGSPMYSAFFTFLTAPFVLTALMIGLGQGAYLSLDKMIREPWWVWIGGIVGVAFVTVNIQIMQRLGAIQTVVLPALGQTLMGLIIDHFGLFGASRIPLSVLRAAGALLVLFGVFLVTSARAGKEQKKKEGGTLFWQLAAVSIGAMSAMQTAANGYVGRVVGSPIRAAIINFLVGLTLISLICLGQLIVKDHGKPRLSSEKGPWWMWIGGLLGCVFITSNSFLSVRIGTGMTVVASLIGIMLGGILIDMFGLFEVPKRPVTLPKILGVLCMIAGAVFVRLL